MNDMTPNQMTALPQKARMFEAAKSAGYEMAQKLDMAFIANVADLENGMPVLIVTPTGMNMGTVLKKTSELDNFLITLYSLNDEPLYAITYPINENGGTGKGAFQSFLPEGSVPYMGW